MPPPHEGVKRAEEVRFGQDGFSLLRDGRLQFHIEWDKVVGIAAFKRDLFAVDEICLGFRYAGSWEYPYVGEQAAGFGELTEEVCQRFAGCDRQWHEKVVLPPFETCWTPVWGDAPEPRTCLRCGYDLRGLDRRRCPECGQIDDPEACSACRGTGVFRDRVIFGLGCVLLAAGGGALVIAVYVCERPWIGLAVGLLIGGGYMTVAGFREFRGVRCRSCYGTGRRRRA